MTTKVTVDPAGHDIDIQFFTIGGNGLSQQANSMALKGNASPVSVYIHSTQYVVIRERPVEEASEHTNLQQSSAEDEGADTTKDDK